MDSCNSASVKSSDRACPTCAVSYPPDGYYRRSNGRMQHECKGCMKVRARANNRSRMAKVRAHKRQMREYAKWAATMKEPRY